MTGGGVWATTLPSVKEAYASRKVFRKSHLPILSNTLMGKTACSMSAILVAFISANRWKPHDFHVEPVVIQVFANEDDGSCNGYLDTPYFISSKCF